MLNPLTSSAEDSPAKTCPSPGRAQDSTERARVFGASTPVSLASFDRDTCSWRTSQLSLLEEWDEFSETWPRSGMTRSGTAYRLQPLAPLIAGIGSGLSRIPTPTAGDAASTANATAGRRNPDSKHHSGTTLTDFIRTWPTPTARDHKDTGENTNYQRIADRSGLAGVVQVREPSWPTPVARDAQSYLKVKRGSGSQESGMERIPPLAVAVSPDGPPANGGQLNPTWVEWLMGFPTAWTVCEAWETRSSRKSRNGSAGA